MNHWYLKNDGTSVKFGTCTQTAIYWTYKWKKSKKLTLKNQTYYFFNDMINVKHFHSNLPTIDKKLYKEIDISNIGYLYHD